MKYRIAAASSDGIVVNEHFGRASVFQIMDVDDKDEIYMVEQRTVKPVCQGGNHDENQLAETVRRLSDCDYILVSRIGQGAAAALERSGIGVYELPGMIEESVGKLLGFVEIQNMLAGKIH